MSLRLKLRSLANRRLEEELGQELASHLEMKAEELEAAGWPPEKARLEARRLFGNLGRTTEKTRELHVFTFLETLSHDIRYALRRLRREPAFTVAAILTLGLVIGANGAVFSLMEAVLLRPLPFPKPEQLMILWGRTTEPRKGPMSVPDMEDYRQARSLAMVAATTTQSVNLTGIEEPTRVIGGFVSSNYLAMLGTRAAAGRLFLPAEDQPGAERVCVVGHSVWQNHFGGADLLGRSIILNNEPYTVVGILPPAFQDRFSPAGIWMPLQFYPNYSRDRGRLNVFPIARLAGGVTLEQARAELSAIARQLQAQYPETNRGRGVWPVPLHEELVAGVRQTVLVLAGAVICVLLIGCSNIAGLLLTKAAGRKQEMAIRASLGAGRGRLVRQLLTESIMLALAGGALGLALASAGMQLMNAFWGDLTGGTVLTLNRTVMAFLLGVSLSTGLLFGLAPAFFARRQTAAAMRQRGSGADQGRLRNILVAAQVSLALVLLIGAGLMLKSVARLSGVDPGFRPERVLTLEYRVPRNKYPGGEQQTHFHQEVVARVSALPGVLSAALIGNLPLSGNFNTIDIKLPDRADPPRESPFTVSYNTATPGYFRTLVTPLLEGRDFTLADTPSTPPVAVVSRSFGRRYWPGQSPLGRQVRVPAGKQEVTAEIVGVVGDIRDNALDDAGIPQLYLPYAQQPFIFATLAVRTSGEPLAMTRSVQKAIWSIDKDQPMWKIRTLQFLVDRSFSYRRYTLALLGGFSVLALVLAAIGIYGVLAYTVTQRTAEFGIRAAIGATPADIVRLIVAKGAVLTVTGLAAGIVASRFLMRYLQTQVYDVNIQDPVVYGSLTLLLLAVAMLAVLLPARRAMRIDPVVALRQE
jgi:putative ABC transport system permease protein